MVYLRRIPEIREPEITTPESTEILTPQDPRPMESEVPHQEPKR